jgi:hypothetical protein
MVHEVGRRATWRPPYSLISSNPSPEGSSRGVKRWLEGSRRTRVDSGVTRRKLSGNEEEVTSEEPNGYRSRSGRQDGQVERSRDARVIVIARSSDLPGLGGRASTMVRETAPGRAVPSTEAHVVRTLVTPGHHRPGKQRQRLQHREYEREARQAASHRLPVHPTPAGTIAHASGLETEAGAWIRTSSRHRPGSRHEEPPARR